MKNQENTNGQTKVHPFEKAGLGAAPFKCVGMEKRVYQASHDAPVQPGDCCDYCGTGIMYVYFIVSSDGNEFVVGSECVLKTAMQEDVELVKTVKKLKKEQQDQVRKERKVKKEEVRKQMAKAAAEEILDQNQELAEDIEVDHHIIKDIKHQLFYWGNISEKQISLVHKIAKSVREREDETFINAPVGDDRREVTATLLSVKWQDNGYYGDVCKGFFKVHTSDGDYKSWGTIPEAAWKDENGENLDVDTIKGRKMIFVAKFKVADNDPTMTFFSRPIFVRWEV